jgi:hypothetical protein
VLTPFLPAGRRQKNDFRLSSRLCESSEAGGKKLFLFARLLVILEFIKSTLQPEEPFK